MAKPCLNLHLCNPNEVSYTWPKTKIWSAAVVPAQELWENHNQYLRKANCNAPVGSAQCFGQDLAIHARGFAKLLGMTWGCRFAWCMADSSSNKDWARKRKKNKEKKLFTHSSVFSPSCLLLLLEIPKHRSHYEGSNPFALQGCALGCIRPFVWAAETITGTGMWGEKISPRLFQKPSSGHYWWANQSFCISCITLMDQTVRKL